MIQVFRVFIRGSRVSTKLIRTEVLMFVSDFLLLLVDWVLQRDRKLVRELGSGD
jgi:hypothetical protein